MATITKDTNSVKLVLGWYGECGGDECLDLDLGQTLRNDLQTVYQFTPDGGARAWSSALPPTFNQRIMKFECGNLYYLLVKAGTGSFTIPNFVVSTYDSGDLGRITSSCEATPTPVICSCTPDNFVSTTPNSSTPHSFMGHTFANFGIGTEISFNDDSFVDGGMGNKVTLMYPNNTNAGIIMFGGGMKPSNTTFIVKHGIVCYSATASSSNEQDGRWELTLSPCTPLSSTCGDPEQFPTPTPEQTPTPTPEQTPTPTPECCSSSHTQFTTISQSEGHQEIIRTYPAGGDTQVAKFVFIDAGATLCVDLTLPPVDSTGKWPEDGTALYSSVYLGDTSGSPIGGFLKNVINDSNSISYIDTNGVCWAGEYTIGDDLVLKKNDSNITEPTPEKTPTPTPEKTPTPTPEKTPTPTPEKTPTPTPEPAPDELQFRWHTTNVQGYGEREVLQIKNNLKPTHSKFSNRDLQNTWSTVYAFTADPSFYSLAHDTWPDVAVATNYDSKHGNSITFGNLTFSFGDVEGSGEGAYKQVKAFHTSGEPTIEFSTDKGYTVPAPLFIFEGDANNETASGVNDFWPVIMKALEEATPTPEPDCGCGPDALTKLTPGSGPTRPGDGHTYGNFGNGVELSYDASSLITGFVSQIKFKDPSGTPFGLIVLAGKSPNNTKFYIRDGEMCYSAVAEPSSSKTTWELTLSTETTLPSGCANDSGGSFADEQDCCSDKVRLPVFGGQSVSRDTEEISEYGIQVHAYDDGRMDGELCWNQPDGELGFQMSKAYQVKFEGFDETEELIRIDSTQPVAGIVFTYKLGTGECFEGTLTTEAFTADDLNIFTQV